MVSNPKVTTATHSFTVDTQTGSTPVMSMKSTVITMKRTIIMTVAIALLTNAFDIVSYLADHELDNHYETTMDLIFNYH